jgi:putative ABC transport system substrate-binding protein
MTGLVDNLVQAHVDIIFACGGDASAQAAKAATKSIPIVFLLGGDPVASGCRNHEPPRRKSHWDNARVL